MPLKQAKWIITLVIMLLMLLAAMYLHLTSGVFTMSSTEVFKTLLRIESTPNFDLVIFDLRLPRIITAALVGMGLAMAGVVLQGITKNALADPGIIGINAGAGCAIVIFMYFFQVELIDVEINSP